jgi:mycothiol synthase
MVHPDYRRQGIFSRLYALVMDECARRRFHSVLLLCDRHSETGQNFLKKIGAEYRYSEFEMYLREDRDRPGGELLRGVSLRRASNADASEVARQNALYFEGNPQQAGEDDQEEPAVLPEDEEKRGMTIYLAERDGRTVGKVHLQNAAGVGGIYGLGVLPEFRGRGYGRAVLLLAVRKLTEEGLSSIMLQVAAENAAALQLYKSCGFRETSTMDYFSLRP